MPGLPPIPVDACEHAEKRLRRSRIILSCITVLLLGIIMLGIISPHTLSGLVGELSPGCAFRRHTGIACPGCGGTRSLRALLAGDIVGAFHYNMLMPFTLLALITEYVRQCIITFTHHADWRNNRFYIHAFVIYAWAVFAWFILRNLFGI